MGSFFRRPLAAARRRRTAETLYYRAVGQARAVALYRALGVPDTLDGRFEMIVLHVVLLFRRLRGEGSVGRTLAQSVFDVMMDDMDRALREMGVGDLGVGRRVKAMAKAFYGRAHAYESALRQGPDALAEALARNVPRGPGDEGPRARRLASYAMEVVAALEGLPGSRLLAGELVFPAPPETPDAPGPDGQEH